MEDSVIAALRVLCYETEQNLSFARGYGFVAGRAPPKRPLAAAVPSSENSGGREGQQLGRLASEMRKLQLSQAQLASSLQQLVGTSAHTAKELAALLLASAKPPQPGGGEAVSRLERRVGELDAKIALALEAQGVQQQQQQQHSGAAKLEECMRRIRALEQEHTTLASTVQEQLTANSHQAASGSDGIWEALKLLQWQLAAGQEGAAAQKAQLGQQVDDWVSRLESLEAAAASSASGEALQRVEAQLQELAAAQEQQAAWLQEVAESKPSRSSDSGDADRRAEQAGQLSAMQQTLDDLAQSLFELRVEMQISAEDANIIAASAKRQAEETQQQSADAASEAERAARKGQQLESRMEELGEQVAALRRKVEALAASRQAMEAPSFGSSPPQGLAGWLKDWLRSELEDLTSTSASHEARLQQLGSQLAGLASLNGTVSSHTASSAALQERLELAQQQQEQLQLGGMDSRCNPAELSQLTGEMAGQVGQLASLGSKVEALQAQQLQQAASCAACAEGLRTVETETRSHLASLELCEAGVRRCEAELAGLQERLGEQLASLESSSNSSSASAERLARELPAVQEQAAEAQQCAQQGLLAAAELRQEVQALPARLMALEKAVGGLLQNLPQVSGELEQQGSQQGQELQEELEGRIERVEATVAGALEEVAGQMVALQAHVTAVEHSVAASVQQAAAVATAVHSQQHLAAGPSRRRSSASGATLPGPPSSARSTRSGGGEPAADWAPQQMQRPVGRESSGGGGSLGSGRGGHWSSSGEVAMEPRPLPERRRTSSAQETLIRRCSEAGQAGAPVIAVAAAGLVVGHDSPPLGSPGEERSLRELFGGGASFSAPAKRPSSTGDLQEQVRQLERALACSDLDEVQREILTSDLEYLREQLGSQS